MQCWTTGLLAVLAAMAALPVATSRAAAVEGATEVTVRVEGQEKTLFEGPLLTDGHRVRASSEQLWRVCDGTNNNQNPSPGPTATAAAYDAMKTVGLDFDGRWYEGYQDYFVQRFGPDAESGDEYWGILVDGGFAPVGGCQMRVIHGQEVLWAYNAFQDRKFLRLGVANDPRMATLGQVPAPTATVALGVPLTLRVFSFTGGMGGAGQEYAPQPGIAVWNVTTDPATDFQRLPTAGEQPSPPTTDSTGSVSLTFNEPGWHRLKAAREGATGPDAFVRSNRLDVCVPPAPPAPSPCDQPPSDAVLRVPPPLPPVDADYPPGIVRPKDTRKGPRLSKPWLLDGLAPRGRFGVRWSILEAGVGVRSWSISSRVLATGRPLWRQRARGTGRKLSARFRLPAGRAHELRFTVTDRLGRRAMVRVGRAVSPYDDRAGRLRFSGAWRRASNATAWLRTLRKGGAGARLQARLEAGRPTFVLRAGRRAARVEVRAAGRSEIFAIAPGRSAALRQVVSHRRSRGGQVELLVRFGEVSVDGVAIQP